jgi:hypothetical protein
MKEKLLDLTVFLKWGDNDILKEGSIFLEYIHFSFMSTSFNELC